jgi:hypothetical protein
VTAGYYCDFCHQELDPTAPGSMRKVIGWVEARGGGGANHVADKSAPLGYAHKICLEVERRGYTHGKKGSAPPGDSLF